MHPMNFVSIAYVKTTKTTPTTLPSPILFYRPSSILKINYCLPGIYPEKATDMVIIVGFFFEL